MNKEEMIQEELELVRCDLHNAYSWLEAKKNDNEKLQQRIDKAIEIIKIDIENCNSALSNPEHKIIGKYTLLEYQKMIDNKLLEILGDSNNE